MTASAKAKVIRCQRCGKRMRRDDGWNVVWIAGLVVGHECPDCQTLDEDLEAELNLITNHPRDWRVLLPPQPEDGFEGFKSFIARVTEALVKSYPTPEVMRHKANQLEDARKDPQASQMVKLMRLISDDMESGELWEPAGQ